MSLFNITRYTGESQLNEEKASKSDLLLSRLNEKALKRKLELASTIETSHSTRGERNPVQKDARTKENSDLKVQKEDSTGHKLAKSKKKSDITEDLNNVSTSALKSNSSPSVTKSKTKKEDVHSASKEESDAAILQMDSAANVSDTADRTEGEQESDSVSGNEDDDRSKEGTADRDIEGDPNKPKSFTVLGEVLKKKKQKVERVLPQWLAHPSVVKADIRSNITPLSGVCGIDQQLTQKLRDNNIHSYFPVQAQVIPALLADHRTGFLTGRAGYRPCDICCSAPTGSGKTLAYVLPIVQCLKARVTCQVRALVVLPVRDLALQVFKVFQTYCEGTPLKVGAVVGLKSFHQEQQSLSQKSPVSGEYQSKVDILVATPGRLVDHINTTPGLSLAHLRYLVTFWTSVNEGLLSILLTLLTKSYDHSDWDLPTGTYCVTFTFLFVFVAAVNDILWFVCFCFLPVSHVSIGTSPMVLLLYISQRTFLHQFYPGNANGLEVTGALMVFIGSLMPPVLTLWQNKQKKNEYVEIGED